MELFLTIGMWNTHAIEINSLIRQYHRNVKKTYFRVQEKKFYQCLKGEKRFLSLMNICKYFF